MARSNIETRGELGGVGWGRDPREGREAWRGPLDGKDSTPIGGRAGWRIEERVGFVRSFCGGAGARGDGKSHAKFGISGGKQQILGLAVGCVVAGSLVGGRGLLDAGLRACESDFPLWAV